MFILFVKSHHIHYTSVRHYSSQDHILQSVVVVFVVVVFIVVVFVSSRLGCSGRRIGVCCREFILNSCCCFYVITVRVLVVYVGKVVLVVGTVIVGVCLLVVDGMMVVVVNCVDFLKPLLVPLPPPPPSSPRPPADATAADLLYCFSFIIFYHSTFVGSAWSFGFFIPATTPNDGFLYQILSIALFSYLNS